MSRIEDEVCAKIQQRAEVGKNKYGVTMERGDLSLLEWLTHLQEELMDATVYVQRLIEETTPRRRMWTHDSWQELLQLKDQHPKASLKKLAEKMGMSTNVISQAKRLMDARIALDKDPIPPIHYSPKTGKPSNKFWTQEEKDEVRAMLQEGHSPFYIAALMDAPNSTSIFTWKGMWGL